MRSLQANVTPGHYQHLSLSLALALSDTVTENKDGRCGEKNLENKPDDYGKQGWHDDSVPSEAPTPNPPK